MAEKLYRVVRFNDQMASTYQNMISGSPDCWDPQGDYPTLPEAEAAVKRLEKQQRSGRLAIRIAGEGDPSKMISDFYRIDPELDPSLAKRERERRERESREKREFYNLPPESDF